MLPDRHRIFIFLWEEYESGVTPEARFVKAFDKGETILQHIQGKIRKDLIINLISLMEKNTSREMKN